jgi:glycosyltransferase involved in cell wall biosynthesis
LRKINLLIIFTFGISLKDWADKGLLTREIQIYKKLTEKGVNVSFLTYGNSEDLLLEHKCTPIKVIPVYSRLRKPANRWLAFLQSFLIPLYFKNEFTHADIIKTNQMLGSWVAVLGKFLYKKKLIIRCGYEMLLVAVREKSSKFMLLLKYFSEYLSYRAANRVVISSHVISNFISKYFRFLRKENKVEIIPNYIDIELFRPRNHKNISRESIGAPNNQKIIYIGRLNREKNLDLVIRALANTDIVFHIVGAGELKEELITLSATLGTNVHFHGVIPNDHLPSVLNDFHVFILPSEYENQPKSLLEAMSCEMIVIGTNVEGIREIIRDGYNGFLCKPDPLSINKTVMDVFSKLEDLSDIRKNARKYVIQNCSLDHVASAEVQLYHELLPELSS